MTKSKIINRVRERQDTMKTAASKASFEEWIATGMAKFYRENDDWLLPPKRWYQFWR